MHTSRVVITHDRIVKLKIPLDYSGIFVFGEYYEKFLNSILI